MESGSTRQSAWFCVPQHDPENIYGVITVPGFRYAASRLLATRYSLAPDIPNERLNSATMECRKRERSPACEFSDRRGSLE